MDVEQHPEHDLRAGQADGLGKAGDQVKFIALTLLVLLAGCRPVPVVKNVGVASGEVAPVTCWTGTPGSEYVVDWSVPAQVAPVIGETWRC
ncbi:hypothetical protein ACVDFE_00340 [Lentzea chajnantorensis]